MSDWRSIASCKGVDPKVFFPKSGNSKGMNLALSICLNCPVKAECLKANLWEPDGVWGGTSAKQRSRIRAKSQTKVRSCFECNKLFNPSNPSVRMCSDNCRTIARRRTKNKKYDYC